MRPSASGGSVRPMRGLAIITALLIVVGTGLGLVAAGLSRGDATRGATPASSARAEAPGAAAGTTQAQQAPPGASGTSLPGALPAADIVRRPEDVPPPITRTGPATVRIDLETKEVVGTVADRTTYTYWTFNGTVPGPLLRVRVGDTVELHLRNAAESTFPHSIDLHAVTGPGGGATVTQTAPGRESTLRFKALNPGVYVYHCATAPVPMHVAQGMYGLILVEPEGGLPPVDRELYLVQGELYTNAPAGTKGALSYDPGKATAEHPDYVVFNGKPAGLTEASAIKAKVGERIRVYFGVGGFLPSSFHVIGAIFDRVYPEAALLDPVRSVQTTLVPAGGAAVVELTPRVPGRYLFVDHTLTRVFDKGAVAHLDVSGPEAPDIYGGTGAAAAGH